MITGVSIIRRTGATVMAAIILVATGCATTRPPEPMTAQQADALKARLGKIAVVGARYAPKAEFQTPAKGAAAGAGAGMVSGALAPLEALSGGGNGYAAILAIALVPVGAVVGGVGGAVMADSAENVNAREATLKTAFADLKMQEALRDRVQARVADLRTFTATLFADQGPAMEGQQPDYQSLKTSGIDTVHEVAIQKLVLTGSGRVNPDLAVRLTARVRLVSTADNKEVLSRQFDCGSTPDKFAAWAAADAQKFRSEIERCYNDLSDRIVKDLYVNNTILR